MPDIKTSFIPQKTAKTKSDVTRRRRPMSILNFIAMTVFFIALTIAGGLHVYRIVLGKQVEEKTADIERAKEAIDPELVDTLTRINRRLNAASELLDNHVGASPIFEVLERHTLQNLRYSDFSYATQEENHALNFSGEARSYETIALQADSFGGHPDMREPIFSNFKLNDESNVEFSLAATFNRDALLYKNMITAEAPPSQPSVIAPEEDVLGAEEATSSDAGGAE